MPSRANKSSAMLARWLGVMAWTLTLPWIVIGFLFASIAFVVLLAKGAFFGIGLSITLAAIIGLRGYSVGDDVVSQMNSGAMRRTAAYLIVGIAFAMLLSVAFVYYGFPRAWGEGVRLIQWLLLSGSFGFALLALRGSRKLRRLRRVLAGLPSHENGLRASPVLLAVFISLWLVVIGLTNSASIMEGPGQAQDGTRIGNRRAVVEQDHELFRTIVAASNQSFESGDWSSFAKLYEDGTLDCWNIEGQPQNHAFFARPPIPDTATHEIKGIENYMMGWEFPSPESTPTHFMEIRHEVGYPSRCDNRPAFRWPKHHFFLHKTGDEFRLVHGCPRADMLARMQDDTPRQALSKARVEELVKRVDWEDREWVAIQKLRRPYNSGVVNHLVTKYDFTYDEATLVFDGLCRKDE